MGLSVSQAGQVEPLVPPALGIGVELVPLHAYLLGRFINCGKGWEPFLLNAGSSSLTVVASERQDHLFQHSEGLGQLNIAFCYHLAWILRSTEVILAIDFKNRPVCNWTTDPDMVLGSSLIWTSWSQVASRHSLAVYSSPLSPWTQVPSWPPIYVHFFVYISCFMCLSMVYKPFYFSISPVSLPHF